MTGRQFPRRQGGGFTAALAVSFLMFAASAQAQSASPSLSSATSVQTAPPAEMSESTYSGLDAVSTSPCECETRCWPCDLSCCETITESLLGAGTNWRPLTLSNFFSEGWREPWAGGPAGQFGLTPRHGWLGAFEGVFYRLWLVNGTYQHDLNKPFGGDGYVGNFTTFLPFSRRFELFFNAPFVAANGTEDPNRGYRSDFGDISVAGSFLLSESRAFTQLFTFGATAPTGQIETGGGLTAVNPRYSFWSNPWGAWVVRGGTGVNVPVSGSTFQTTYNANLAIGRYFTPHDVPLGDLVFYVNCNTNVPLEGGGPSQVGVGPGTRFQIGGNWYFLHFWDFQVGADRPFDYQIQTAIVKAW